MPLKRIVLIIMCSILAVMVIMMGVMVGKVAPVLNALLGSDEDTTPTVPPTTQTEPTTEPTTQPTVPPTTQPTVPPTTEPKHEHDYSTVKEEKKPTCATAGHKIYVCSCGDTKLETIDPLTHSFGAGKLIAPTCTESGYTLRKCSICGFEDKQDEKEALGHDMKFVKEIKVTCDKQGYVENKCARTDCGKIEHENIQDPTGHTWVKGEVHDPTCTKEGYTEYTCSNKDCKEKKEDDKIPALGHKFGAWAVVTEPEAGKPGEEERKCSVCEEKETREQILKILEENGFNTGADNEGYYFIINVGAKDSNGKEVKVYSYSVTDYSRTLSSGSFSYDPESGLLITVKDKEEPYALEPGNGKLTLDKKGEPVVNEPDPTVPSEPTETTDPSEPTGTTDPSQPAASEPTGSGEGQ